MKKIIKTFMVISILTLSTGIVAQTSSNAKNGWYAPKSANTIENPLNNDKKSINNGKALYNQFCSVCHGFKGKGDGLAGAALNPKPANFTSKLFYDQTDGAIFWKLTEGKPPMASYKDILTETQRWSVINYIRTMKKR